MPSKIMAGLRIALNIATLNYAQKRNTNFMAKQPDPNLATDRARLEAALDKRFSRNASYWPAVKKWLELQTQTKENDNAR
jgi:hypothetical protein